MGLFDFLRPKPKMSPDRVIEYGAFLVALNKATDMMGVDRSGPIEVRVSAFLWLGSDVATSPWGLMTEGRPFKDDEGAALVMFVQQGIHAMLTLYDGHDAVKTAGYRGRFTKIVSLAIPRILGSDVVDLTPECVRLMEQGAKATRKAQGSNVDLLQSIYDAWQEFLHTPNDQAVRRMEQTFGRTLEWVGSNR